jgi:hypothetical protein
MRLSPKDEVTLSVIDEILEDGSKEPDIYDRLVYFPCVLIVSIEARFLFQALYGDIYV